MYVTGAWCCIKTWAEEEVKTGTGKRKTRALAEKQEGIYSAVSVGAIPFWRVAAKKIP